MYLFRQQNTNTFLMCYYGHFSIKIPKRIGLLAKQMNTNISEAHYTMGN